MRMRTCFFLASFISSFSYAMKLPEEEHTVLIACSDGIVHSTCVDLISKFKTISIMLSDLGDTIGEPIPLLTSSQHFDTFITLAKKEKNELDELLIFLSIHKLNELAKLANYMESEDFKQKLFKALAHNIILFDESGSLTDWDEVIVQQMIEKFSQPMSITITQPNHHTAYFTLFATKGNQLKKIFDKMLDTDVFSLCISPDKTHIAVGLHALIKIYHAKNTHDYQHIYELSCSSHQIYSLCFNSSLKILASASCCPHKVIVWDLPTKNIIHAWQSSALIRSLCWNNNGELLAAGTEDGIITIGNIKEKSTVMLAAHLKSETANRIIWTIDFSPNSQQCASGGLDRTIRVWDLKTKQCINALSSHTGCINTVRYSPNGNYIASSANDGSAKIWESSTGKLLITLQFFSEKNCTFSPRSLCWSPDGNYIATSSYDNILRIWGFRILTKLHEIKNMKMLTTDTLKKEKAADYTITQTLYPLGAIFKNSSLSFLVAGIHHQLMWSHKEEPSF